MHYSYEVHECGQCKVVWLMNSTTEGPWVWSTSEKLWCSLTHHYKSMGVVRETEFPI